MTIHDMYPNIINFCRAGGVGDILMCIPGIRLLRETYPKLQINAYVSHPEILKNLSFPINIYPFSERPSDAIWLNYENQTTSNCHISKIFGSQLGVFVIDVRPECNVNLIACDKFKSKLAHLPHPWVLVNRNASGWTPNKEWPDLFWNTLIESLLFNYSVIEIGHQRNEKSIIKNLRYINLRGETSLEDIISLMYLSDLHVGPISGPVHIAAAFHVPSVVIYGGYEPPILSEYPGNISMANKLTCSPCWLTDPCPINLECMRLISPEAVKSSIDQLFTKIKL